MKKFLLTTLTITTLALALTFALPVKETAVASAAASTSLQSVDMPRVNIFALGNDNSLFVLRIGASNFARVGTISNVGDAQVIGIDFRVADNQLYALTDNSRIYTINTTNAAATLVSTLNPQYNGGVQSLLDFNPVANAIRLIGTDDLNYAVVNAAGGGNLNQTVVQTKVAYAAGDQNVGRDPYITAGSYTNNFAGATTTIFYAIDYKTDKFVTIANKVNGSSATGGGQLQTIGSVFDNNNINGGTPVNFRPTCDVDIVTINRQVNVALITNGNRLLVLSLSQINQNLAVGASQNLGAFGVALATGGFLDIAMQTPGPLN
jgi:Domain of unknown function (DUF4394)